jgi:5-methylthioadenosine/S-adenosylhomocysteine deaminase
VSLKEATDLLADGMHRLPELAKDMDKQKLSPDDTFLVLDHEDDGVDLRPHLPGPNGDLTAMLDGFASATPLADLLVPLKLDPLTVFDDHDFVDTLAAEKNLPKEVADHVPDLF